MGNVMNSISGFAGNLYNGAKSGISKVYNGIRGVSNFIAGGLDKFDGWLDSFSGIPVLGELSDMFQFNPIYQTIRGGIKQVDEIIDELDPIGRGLETVLDPLFGSGATGTGGARRLHNQQGARPISTGMGAGDQRLSPVSGGVLAPPPAARPVLSPVGGGVRLPGPNRTDAAGNTTVEGSIRFNQPLRGQNISSALR